MSDSSLAPDRAERPSAPPWSMPEVLLAALASLVISVVVGSLIFTLAGVEDADDASLGIRALVQASLWIGMLGAAVGLVRARGGRVGVDLGLSGRWIDLPVGAAVGVAGQLLLVPLISAPWAWLIRGDLDSLSEPACRLATKADDPVGVGLLVLIAVVGAPIVEEIFFRGFAQRAAVARFGRPIGIVVVALIFAVVHYQALQFGALLAFGLVLGLLADRTGRLGPSIVAHMAFNATTVVSLVQLDAGSRTCRELLGLAGLA